MANLHFLYGAMGASKSAELIKTAFNFEKKNVPLESIKPAFDKRFSETEIVSRMGTRTKAAALPSLANYSPKPDTKVLLVDEVQFFTPADIDTLVHIADVRGIITMCYGLMTDSNEEMFAASKRLVEVGAKLHLLECSCEIPGCMKLATHNLRFDDVGGIVRNGEKFQLGANNFKGVCRDHYYSLYHLRQK